MELVVLITLLAHILMAMGVGAHAEVTGRRHWRWAPIVLVTGVFGVVWYLFSTPPKSPTDSPLEAADTPEAALDRRPREKRLADPNTLHVDLPDGTSLTGTEQKAVSAVIERMREAGDGATGDADTGAVGNTTETKTTGSNPAPIDPGALGRGPPQTPSQPAEDDLPPLPEEPPPTKTLIEDVFEEQQAGYRYPDVWWTDLIHPALDALPAVEPPTDADEHDVELQLREVYDEREGTTVEATDGERTGQFRIRDGRVEAADSSVYAETSPRWAQYAKEYIAEHWEHRDWSVDGEERDRELETARR